MPRPKSDIEPRILHAARARFLREGVDGASLRAIARDAGTNIGMIYYYFPTKDDLFLAVVEEVYTGLLQDMSRALAPDLGVDERVRRLFHRIGETSEEELLVVRLVIREALISSERLAKLVERFQRGHLPLILATLLEGQERGILDASLPPALLLVLTFAIGALPQLARRAGGSLPIAALPAGHELGDRLHDLWLRALGAPAPQAKGED